MRLVVCVRHHLCALHDLGQGCHSGGGPRIGETSQYYITIGPISTGVTELQSRGAVHCHDIAAVEKHIVEYILKYLHKVRWAPQHPLAFANQFLLPTSLCRALPVPVQ